MTPMVSNTMGRRPVRHASTPAQMTATACTSIPATRVPHAACPLSHAGTAMSQNRTGPGWFQRYRLYGPTRGVSAVNTSRTRMSVTATSWIGSQSRPIH